MNNMDLFWKSNKELRDITRRVAIYARVSTEHEAQLYALENQIEWYNEILSRHDNWTIVERYIDRGITGTSAKKRPSFMQMIEDAQDDKFDLIITREVSRFARNTVDTLQYTRELKKNNIEVYFVEDNIWTFDPDGELRLTIMATLAQDESRKTSLRAKAGQRTSMEKGVYFQNGSLLGYDYDKNTRQLTINEEQAVTVRTIFDLYNSGMGVRKIQWELEKLGYKTATGSTLWSASVISRVLKNKIYAGYLVWYKQFVPDYLEQKKINNHGQKEQFEVKASHVPIVTLEEWQKANDRLASKRINESGQKTKRDSVDVWTKKLRCTCGCSFNRRAWHKDAKNGKEYYGYMCYNVVKSGTKKTRESKGLSMEGICQAPSVSRWKLEAMALYIFKNLSINKEHIIEICMDEIEKHINETSDNKSEEKIKLLEKELEKMKRKVDNLIDMRSDGEISKEEFILKKHEYDDKIEEINNRLSELTQDEVVEDYATRMKMWKECLDKMLNFQDAEKIPEYIIDAMVDYILVDGDTFKWKLRFLPDDDDYNLKIKGTRERNSSITDAKSGDFLAFCYGQHRQRLAKDDNSIFILGFRLTKLLAIQYTPNWSPRDRVISWHDLFIEIYF